MQWMTIDAISKDGIMCEFLYLSALANHLVTFCDDLSSKVPYCDIKLFLCLSTVSWTAPTGAICPSLGTISMIVVVVCVERFWRFQSCFFCYTNVIEYSGVSTETYSLPRIIKGIWLWTRSYGGSNFQLLNIQWGIPEGEPLWLLQGIVRNTFDDRKYFQLLLKLLQLKEWVRKRFHSPS